MRHYLGPNLRRGRTLATRFTASGVASPVAALAKPDDALALAVRLYRSPGLVRSIRRSPLPPEMMLVIRIAAGCPVSCAFAVAKTGLDEAALVRIATLYLLVVLFEQETDPHRTLGLSPGAPAGLVQDHKKWLLKWLHPDRNANANLAALAVRVLVASAALTGAVQAFPARPGEAREPAAAAPLDVPDQRRKHRVRHIWVPQRVDG